MPEHKSLAEALVAFQAEAPTLAKDGVNPHFKSKFTPLDTIVETVQPLLAKHGLAWSTFPCFGPNDQPALRYKLRHVSGEVEEDTMPLLAAKTDPQGQGSAITYARRYAICAVLNLVADDDDDGNSASQRQRPQAQAAPVQNGNGDRLASPKQRSLIFARADENKLSNTQLASVVLAATESPNRKFDSEDAAGEWLRRAFERLPAAKVNPILEALTT